MLCELSKENGRIVRELRVFVNSNVNFSCREEPKKKLKIADNQVVSVNNAWFSVKLSSPGLEASCEHGCELFRCLRSSSPYSPGTTLQPVKAAGSHPDKSYRDRRPDEELVATRSASTNTGLKLIQYLRFSV